VVNSGWGRVSGVLTVTSRIVGELRVQQGTRGGNRENQLRGYAGRYMSDEGIQKWIEEQGGLVTLVSVIDIMVLSIVICTSRLTALMCQQTIQGLLKCKFYYLSTTL
jgi:hypothetical protein